MSSLNKAILIGHLGRDPETRYMANGDAVTSLAVATSDKWKDKTTGEQKEQTEWHRITVFRKLAEICAQYLKKGSLVYIEGKIKTRKYTDKDGAEKYVTEIIADSMQMLGGGQGNSHGARGDDQGQQALAQSRQSQNAARSNQAQGGGFHDMDDDIPY